jgi:hypothetical protein
MANGGVSWKVKDVAHDEEGVHELPDGSNNGPKIREYMACTWLFVPKQGQQGWFWCVAFWQWVIKESFGHQFPYRTAACFQLVPYCKKHGLLTNTPKLWDAAILSGHRHITFLEEWLSGGRFYCFGGNQSNAVQRNVYTRSDVIAWISTEAVAKYVGFKPKPKRALRLYEVVTQEDGQKQRVYRARTLRAISKRIDQLTKAGKTFTFRRKK